MTTDFELQRDYKNTPMMEQWANCKKAASDALLMFRMGDFYEAFYEDAGILARELDLTLTKRQDVPMSGIPHRAAETYIDRLVAKGFRVAVAEQTEDPKKTKGLVKREIARIVTPGTVINSSLLSEKSNRYIASITALGKLYGIAFLDLTTADFRVLEVDSQSDLLNEIYRLRPAELVLSPKFQEKQRLIVENLAKTFDFVVSSLDDWRFDGETAFDFLIHHFKVQTLDGFGLKNMPAATNAGGALLSYLQDILCLPLSHVKEVNPYSISEYMTIDRATERHLELIESQSNGSKKNTLLSTLDKTLTPMGSRLLLLWLKQPLLDPALIAERQDAIQTLISHPEASKGLQARLCLVRDIERLNMKIVSGYASPKDLVALKSSFQSIPELKAILHSISYLSTILDKQALSVEPLPELIYLIERAIVEDPPMRVSEGKVFCSGYCKELDELREISTGGKAWLSKYQNELRESTGIKTLKVGFNRMFGYYIEVSKGQIEKTPDHFQRRQTLVNAERYITPELKNYETQVMHAEERIEALEANLFNDLRSQVSTFSETIQRTAKALSIIDVIQSLASVAHEQNYKRPVVDKSSLLQISSGRHPVIETSKTAEQFIANDTYLDSENNRMLLITGPNMAGKSTYIRQVALITIMAQIGSFVPATSAHIGIIDKVFSRIGASDDLSRGQSTFMVEMTETANILNNATARSLVILDEIGRGTSTYDGISIAWSVAEYLLTTEGKTAKTLFATHYWELTQLEEKVPGAVNYHVAVHESNDEIIFLRKVIRGGTDKSYGIHVGRLAGLPSLVIERAKEILAHLEENANQKRTFEPKASKQLKARQKETVPIGSIQLTFFG